ncbi:MAG: ATP-binding protein [Candidatus Hydrogenedens sp.]
MIKRKIISIDSEKCNGCGLCVNACAEGAIKLINGKAQLVSDVYCDGLGACLPHCPTLALSIVEREAEPFDEELVKLQQSINEPKTPIHTCPSIQFKPDPARKGTLSYWPIQIRLVPPMAHYLQNAKLLVVADCVPIAYQNFHSDFLQDHVVLVGCPKFDPKEQYVQKFAEIFTNNDIKNVTIPVMEVPCCQALPNIVLAGLQYSGKNIPVEKIIISIQGEILGKQFING